ncbi:hypothetical protein O6H91_14G050600 [Diphasiastrum complanatum]|uniref:Uncharacterized protein n=1 Tax=Diphasiastrum complanatum TaxID=34168 RepID=A0ACC2BPD7_DIPCM|nr:hypothetical protein O6H91_14G050600 [Diphasiastrum complanatum]
MAIHLIAPPFFPPSPAAGNISTQTAFLCTSVCFDPPRATCKHSCTRISHTITAILKNQEIQRWALAPNVRKIGRRELDQVLPWTGSKTHCWRLISDPQSCLVRLGVSLAASVLLYDISTLGVAVAFLYWIWGPMWSAALFNSRLRLRYPYAGVWHAKLFMAQVGSSAARREMLQDDVNTLDWSLMRGIFERSPKLYITVGDESQASFQMELPISSEKACSCKIGEHVDVLVLSDCPKISRFKAIREVYSPESGVWISEQACINRKKFELLSNSLLPSHLWS